MADYWKDLTQGAPAAPQPPAGGRDYWNELTANAPSLNAATPEHAAALAKDRFGAMQKSYTDALPNSASLWTTFKASLPLDIKKRIKIFADARGLPVDDYGVDAQGNVGYIDPQKGGWVREVPTLGGGSWTQAPLDQFMRLGHQAADNAGPLSSQVVGGGAGALAPGPLKIPAAAGAAFVTDLTRQGLGNIAAGSSILDDMSLWNAAGQAALAGTGEAAGAASVAGYNRAFGRNTLRASPADVRRLQNPTVMQDVNRLYNEATNRGIWLSPGNATNARSLRVVERRLGREPDAQDPLYDAYAARDTQQVPGAVRAELDQISPMASPALGARSMQQGGEATLEGLRAQRSAAASPHYVAAFNSGVVPDIQPVLDAITNAMPGTAQSSASRRVLDTAYHDLTGTVTQRIGGRPVQVRVPITNYEHMHSAKEAVDSTLDTLEQKGFNQSEITKARAALTPIQQQLTRILRAAHPEYEQGYQAYINASPAVDEAAHGLVGLAAQDRIFYQNVPNIISTGDPISIASARISYARAGQTTAWNDGLRAYLENALRKSLKVTQQGAPSNVSGKFYQQVYGEPTQRANLEAAFGSTAPGRFQSFQRLLDVLEAAARSLPEGSPTASDLPGRGAFVGRAARAAGNVARGANPFNVPDMAGDAIWRFSNSRNAAALADIYTNNDAMRQLARLRLMRPGSQQALRFTYNVLKDYGYLELPTLDKPEMVPPRLSAPIGASR